MKMGDVKMQLKQNEFPDELTFDQFDKMGWKSKQFGLNDDRHYGEIARDVLAFAKKSGGQIYTQVDGDNDRLYSKGMRFVNRTGLWEVVTGEPYRIDNR